MHHSLNRIRLFVCGLIAFMSVTPTTQAADDETSKALPPLMGEIVQPTEVQRLPSLNAYQVPESQLPIDDGRVQYVLGDQIASTESWDFNLGGNCDYPHGRRGFGCPHPWRTGPGWCDDWQVGPHWDVSLDGVILHREALDAASLGAVFGANPGRVEQFNYQAGARGYATGRGIMGYDVQLGYVGVDKWRAYADYVVANVGNRNVEYRTGFHSVELNIMPRTELPWRLLTGVRYIQLNEDIFARDLGIDVENSNHIDNKLIGFQIGGRRDLWTWGNRFSLDGLFNAGLYSNQASRFTKAGTISGGTSIVRRVEENNIAFATEAVLSGVYRVNRCLALRGGYQLLYLDGVVTADAAFATTAPVSSSVLYHGLQVGLEYRR